MSRFSEALKSGRFVVTTEISPPKGVNISKNLGESEALRVVDAINVTDQQASVMRLGPLSLCRILKEKGFEPICQFTCRDRNRIALQSDLLSAYVLGLENILCLTGDPTGTGDHPEAKAVFDLDAVTLLEAVKTLEGGKDLAGHPLDGNPKFFAGAAATPETPLDVEMPRMEKKVKAGARFFQTQGVYDTERFAQFMESARSLGMPVLAGIIVLKSGKMARYMNRNVPGIKVPDHLIEELDGAEDKGKKGIEIAARTIQEVKGVCQGVHIMPIDWEKKVPDIMVAAGLLDKRTTASR